MHPGRRGRFVSPETVFWQQTPFGKWSTTLPESWLAYKPFFDAVGVKNEPGPTEIAAVLRAILDEFGTDPVDPSGETAIHGCWTRLSETARTSRSQRRPCGSRPHPIGS